MSDFLLVFALVGAVMAFAVMIVVLVELLLFKPRDPRD